MVNEVKRRPSLSVLLAIKGLVPLETDCADRVVADTKDKIVIRRYYQGDPDFARTIELPAASIKPYEYEETPFKKAFSVEKGRFVHKPVI